jgi:hypothetical protein
MTPHGISGLERVKNPVMTVFIVMQQECYSHGVTIPRNCNYSQTIFLIRLQTFKLETSTKFHWTGNISQRASPCWICGGQCSARIDLFSGTAVSPYQIIVLPWLEASPSTTNLCKNEAPRHRGPAILKLKKIFKSLTNINK